MGIKGLNRYLRNNCSSGINIKNLSELQDKTITIDTSIYLYKFSIDNEVIESFYSMIVILKKYNIKPLFVFDGVPLNIKDVTLNKRKFEKEEAHAEYNRLKRKICKNYGEKKLLQKKLNELKRCFISINDSDIKNVKRMFDLFGVMYITADHEADVLCSDLVIKGKAWACMSEDMDMFIYGCPRVLKYFSILKNTVVLYELNGILKSLDMDFTNFKNICILSGTDYNSNLNTGINIFKIFELFYKYKSLNIKYSFYTWLNNTTEIIENFKEFINIHKVFKLSNEKYDNLNINFKNIQKDDLLFFLEEFNFVHLPMPESHLPCRSEVS